METVLQMLSQPFVWGLLLGLLIAGFVWKSGWAAKSTLKNELKRLTSEQKDLQSHLNTHLKISATGNEALQSELKSLKTQNENLRVNLAALQQKPGRAEIRQWQIIEAAVSRMREQAPGFAPAWEQALRAATLEIESSESGLTKLIRRVLPGNSSMADRSPGSEVTSLMERDSESNDAKS